MCIKYCLHNWITVFIFHLYNDSNSLAVVLSENCNMHEEQKMVTNVDEIGSVAQVSKKKKKYEKLAHSDVNVLLLANATSTWSHNGVIRTDVSLTAIKPTPPLSYRNGHNFTSGLNERIYAVSYRVKFILQQHIHLEWNTTRIMGLINIGMNNLLNKIFILNISAKHIVNIFFYFSYNICFWQPNMINDSVVLFRPLTAQLQGHILGWILRKSRRRERWDMFNVFVLNHNPDFP